LTQDQVAVALGTKKSNISRLESGHYGGLTIEYFMAVIDAFRALDQASSNASAGAGRRGVIPVWKPPNKAFTRRDPRARSALAGER
jgi:transcriptional regulator with XRE-family HTH domain